MAKAPSIKMSADASIVEENLLVSLKKSPVFRGVNAEVFHLLIESASPRFILGGNFIFKQDDPASSLIIFFRGLAVEFKQSGNIDCLINYYSEPSVLGEASFLESCNRTTSLFANEDCWITEIDNHIVTKLAFSHPDQLESLYINLGRELGKKVVSINEKLSQAESVSFSRERMMSWNNYL